MELKDGTTELKDGTVELLDGTVELKDGVQELYDGSIELRDGMEEFKLYSVSDEYIEYLRKVFPNVYSNKETTRVHTRKYIGTVVCLETIIIIYQCLRQKNRIIRLRVRKR